MKAEGLVAVELTFLLLFSVARCVIFTRPIDRSIYEHANSFDNCDSNPDLVTKYAFSQLNAVLLQILS